MLNSVKPFLIKESANRHSANLPNSLIGMRFEAKVGLEIRSNEPFEDLSFKIQKSNDSDKTAWLREDESATKMSRVNNLSTLCVRFGKKVKNFENPTERGFERSSKTMWSLPIGVVVFAAAIFFSTPLSSWGAYINAHSILIVMGCTVGVFAYSTPWTIIKALFKSVKELTEKEKDLADFAEELAQLAETRQLNKPSEHPLINYALELWDNGTSTEIFLVLISQRRDSLESTKAEALSALKNLAKYPPALGMVGTVMGMVTLFSNLSADNRAGVGPALGLAMTATFFGLILANGVLLPLADRLSVHHQRWKNQMQSVYELLLLINRREPPTLVRGEVNDRIASAA